MCNGTERIQFSTCVKVDDDIVYFTRYGNFLMKMNLNNYHMQYMKNIHGDNNSDLDVADRIVAAGNVLYQLNNDGRYVLKYELQSGYCKKINIDCKSKSWGNYISCEYYHGKIYIFSRYKNNVAIINTTDDEVKYDDAIIKKISNENSKVVLNEGFRINNIMWLFSIDGKVAMSFDMSDYTVESYKLPIQINKCSHVIFYKDKFYILDSCGSIYIWDKKEEILLCKVPDAKNEEYERMAVTDKNIIIFPSLGDNIYIYDFEKNTISKYIDYPFDFKYSIEKDWGKYYGYCEDDGKYYYAMRLSNYMPVVDKQKGTIEWVKPKAPDIMDMVAMCKQFEKNIYREEMWSLDEYIKIIV